ncbi:MAG: DUF3426 domain-containing protein [Woeseiaceae bacterium]|nr:DUF3426 domain-containing protein [Woeseiaceae bacterium]
MYTQCPECSVAFRVTAEVLKQAAGKVRCGGCGSAFNALEHLSETKPKAPLKREAEPQLPELKPDEPVELEADTPPESISAEQSAALLKTLDELAGSDIRIEDTGVEWRVLDKDVEQEPQAKPAKESDPAADTGSLKFFIQDDEPEGEEQAAKSAIEDMRFDDDTPLPEDFDLDAPAAPAVRAAVKAEPVAHIEEAPVDLELGEPEEWQDLLGEVEEPEQEPEAEPEPDGATDEDVPVDDIVVLSDAVDDEPADEPLDMDTQFALQAEAMGIDLSGTHAIDASEEDSGAEFGDEESETTIDDDLIAAAFETEAAAKSMAKAEELALPEEQEEIELEFADEEEEPAEETSEDEEPAEEEAEAEAFEEEIALAARDGEAYTDASLVEELDDIDKIELDDEVIDEITQEKPEFDIPEMSEEEKTINMMIDQDLLAIAVEDDDGFASTIVQIQPDDKVEKEIEDNREVEEEPETETEAEAPAQGFETIIMEGDIVRGQHDAKRSEKNRRLGDAMKAKRAEEDRKKLEASKRPSLGMVAGLGGLALLLLLQVVHQSRESLATIPAFSDAIGPVYRMLGKPVTPSWDITGWTIEATTGSTDETEELLTIYSRIANKSDTALPYPLVHVSLTDRFEEIIGSRVLQPAEYLASDLDPRDPVLAGNTFNAVIAIESPAPESTGYKLSVCYRLTGGQLSCAIEDFK